jgi:hypothetical protein
MVTSTGKEIRTALSQEMGDYTTLTTSSVGDLAKSTLIDTGLKNLSGGGDDDAFEGQFVLIADSDSGADGDERRVKQYSVPGTDGNSPTITVEQLFSDQIASGISYELHRYSPTLKREAINRAARQLYPTLYLPIIDESIVINSFLTDGGMENWTSGALDSWDEVNSPTVTQETSRVFHKSSSAKIVGPSGSVGQLTQAASVNMAEVSGLTATMRAWGWTNAASQARLRLDWDGSDIANGNYHAGDSEWERLSVSATIPTTATQVKAILEVTADDTAYFDHVYLLITPIYRYTLPTSLVGLPNRVTMQYSEPDVDGPYYPFRPNSLPLAGRILRIQGKGLLSQPDSDTATIEIEAPHLELLVAYASMLLWRTLASPARSAATQREGYKDAAKDAADQVALLARKIRTPRIGSLPHESIFHYEQDSNGRYLVFDRTQTAIVI